MYAFVILYSIYYFFAATNSKVYRNNFVYNQKYIENTGLIYQSMIESIKNYDEVRQLLNS